MNHGKIKLALVLTFTAAGAGCAGMMGPSNPMTFFVTSANPGDGGNLGGLAGADKHCQTLAESVGAGSPRVWRAYLSTTPSAGAPAENARDRIGRGPWQNAKGVVIAKDVDELHGTNNLTKETAITEKGAVVNGRGDKPNMHDILTGSSPEGRAMSGSGDTTCGNWTRGGEGSAIVGHHDRVGLSDTAPARSWNSSHPSKGCSMDNLRSTGGAGMLYCFAAR